MDPRVRYGEGFKSALTPLSWAGAALYGLNDVLTLGEVERSLAASAASFAARAARMLSSASSVTGTSRCPSGVPPDRVGARAKYRPGGALPASEIPS